MPPTYWTCFCFLGYFHMQPFRGTFKNKSTKTSRNFERNMWSSSSSFFMGKQQSRPQSNKKKLFFLPSSHSYNMLWETGWPNQLYVLFIVKTWHFMERDSDIMIKASRLHHWVNIGDFIVKFENVFVCWDQFWKLPPWILLRISEVLERNICGGVLL